MREIWQETCALRFGAVDRSDRLTLAATFDFFQEAAINHAEDLGVGREAVLKNGQGWILSRISVVLEHRPKYRETITIRSWPRGGERLFAVRDYDIRDASGVPIVRGRSGWLILDLEKRRPLRPQSMMDKLPLNAGLDALPDGPAALETRDNLNKAGERRAVYSDIDYNGHVNNARYIQWIQDITDPEILEKADTLRLDINYLRETKINEITDLWTAPLTGSGITAALAYEGRRQEGGQATFRAELRTGGPGCIDPLLPRG
ncbi:MAG: acyl-ACP thioesterase [Treponema sp.]|jgi:acyl-ACP thioesterase|nr:acyl-ACP thioesterase [Treponema sp.]